MSKKTVRTYSRYTSEAIKLLAGRIKVTRLDRKITAKELCERAGISRGLLQRIENADPACSVGVIFEVATILGLQLFQSDISDLAFKNKMIEDKLTLLPSRARKTKKPEIDDDF